MIDFWTFPVELNQHFGKSSDQVDFPFLTQFLQISLCEEQKLSVNSKLREHLGGILFSMLSSDQAKTHVLVHNLIHKQAWASTARIFPYCVLLVMCYTHAYLQTRFVHSRHCDENRMKMRKWESFHSYSALLISAVAHLFQWLHLWRWTAHCNYGNILISLLWVQCIRMGGESKFYKPCNFKWLFWG